MSHWEQSRGLTEQSLCMYSYTYLHIILALHLHTFIHGYTMYTHTHLHTYIHPYRQTDGATDGQTNTCDTLVHGLCIFYAEMFCKLKDIVDGWPAAIGGGMFSCLQHFIAFYQKYMNQCPAVGFVQGMLQPNFLLALYNWTVPWQGSMGRGLLMRTSRTENLSACVVVQWPHPL